MTGKLWSAQCLQDDPDAIKVKKSSSNALLPVAAMLRAKMIRTFCIRQFTALTLKQGPM